MDSHNLQDMMATLLTRFNTLEESQSLFLSVLSAQTATIQSLESQVRQLETTLHQQARQNTNILVRKIDKISNVCKVFNTRFTHLPHELLVDILKFLPTLEALDFRRICRRFNTAIVTRQFAALNLAIHPMDMTKGLNKWLTLPEPFQEILAEGHAMQSQKTFELLTWSSAVKSIPKDICKLTELRVIKMVGLKDAHKLVGSIPKGICSLVNLVSLNLSKNKLFGEIPLELFSLSQLQELNLSNNAFRCEIPREIGRLTNLVVLSLESNHLFGEIPDEIRTLTMLTTLHLHSNGLYGELPAALWTLTRLESLCLTLNMFNGEISPDIRNLQNLRFLNLSMLNVRWPFEFQKNDFPHLEKSFVQTR